MIFEQYKINITFEEFKEIKDDYIKNKFNKFHNISEGAKELTNILKNKLGIKIILITSLYKDFIELALPHYKEWFNSDFDMSFIQYNCLTKLHINVENDVIDALPLARKHLPDLPNKKLETIKRHFNLDVGSHNAIDDCIVTNHLYQYCKQYEAIRFKYVIPFTYQAQELKDIEVEYLNTVVEILEKNGIKKSEMGMDYTSKFLRLYDRREGRFAFDIRIKMYGKLKYVLLDVPLSRFEAECNTDIKHTEGSSDERGKTR